MQIIKHRAGGRVVHVEVAVIYGAEMTLAGGGAHPADVERLHLTSRQMQGRRVRKPRSFSKELERLKATCVGQDAVYNLRRAVKTLRLEVKEVERRFQPRTPAMAAGLTDYLWSIQELLWTVVPPSKSTRSG